MKPNTNYNLSQSLMDAVSKIVKNYKAANDNDKKAVNNNDKKVDANNDNDKKAVNNNDKKVDANNDNDKKAVNNNDKAKIGKGPRDPVNLKPTITDQ